MISNRLGFTLIECLIAMVMMVVVSFSISYMNYTSKMDKKATGISLNCNQILQNTMNQISSIGRKLDYIEVYQSGELKPTAGSDKELYNSAFIKEDIVNILRRDQDAPTIVHPLFTSGDFVCGNDHASLFTDLDQHVLEDLCIKIEQEVWNIDTDEKHNTCGINTANPCQDTCCPRPKALCEVQSDSTCTTTLDPKDSSTQTNVSSEIHVNGRSDIGYKVKLSLVVLCDNPADPTKCNKDPEKDEDIEMQCDMDRVFSYAPDTIPIKFKEKIEPIEDEGDPISDDDYKADNNVEILTVPPTIDPALKKYIYGKSYLFRENIHDDAAQCGVLEEITPGTKRLFKATFELLETTEELLSSVFYCKIDHKVFQSDSGNPPKANPTTPGWDLKEGEWKPCDNSANNVGAITEIKVFVDTADKDDFRVEFSYKPEIDADHRIHLVAVDPAGNASEIKRISFASKNCKKYLNNLNDPLEKMHCKDNPYQWCEKIDRNPWEDLQDTPDPLNNSVNIYDHRKNGASCRYYKIVEKDYTTPTDTLDPNLWNTYGCSISSCCIIGNSGCSCPITTEDQCNIYTYSSVACTDMLPRDGYVRKRGCEQPNSGQCQSKTCQTNPPHRKPGAPPPPTCPL